MKKLKLKLDGIDPLNKEQMRKIRGGVDDCTYGTCGTDVDCGFAIPLECYNPNGNHNGFCVTLATWQCLESTSGNWSSCCGGYM